MSSIKINIACRNLQHLFDTTVSDIAADLEFIPCHGCDAQALNNKLDNLAQIIELMHGAQGPGLLGVRAEGRTTHHQVEQLIEAPLTVCANGAKLHCLVDHPHDLGSVLLFRPLQSTAKQPVAPDNETQHGCSNAIEAAIKIH